MEKNNPEILIQHTDVELRNLELTRHDTIVDWLQSTYTPSSLAIPQLHKNLLNDVEEYQLKGIGRRHQPGVYREEDLKTFEGEPKNLFCRGTDISPVMREYATDLDSVLSKQHERRSYENNLPSPIGHIEETIHDAARLYYAFIRIHPFLDGNGRTGRFIVSRIVMGGGLEELNFGGDWYANGAREEHLNAMYAVDHTADLTHLELYLLNTVLRIYEKKADEGVNKEILREIETAYAQKAASLSKSQKPRTMGDIWEPFRHVDIAGPEDFNKFEKKAA